MSDVYQLRNYEKTASETLLPNLQKQIEILNSNINAGKRRDQSAIFEDNFLNGLQQEGIKGYLHTALPRFNMQSQLFPLLSGVSNPLSMKTCVSYPNPSIYSSFPIFAATGLKTQVQF